MKKVWPKRNKHPKLVFPGDLMLAVLGCVWRDSDMSLPRIQRAVALTYKVVTKSAVSTTLTHLVDRGWLVTNSVKYNRKYSAGITRDELATLFVEKINAA